MKSTIHPILTLRNLPTCPTGTKFRSRRFHPSSREPPPRLSLQRPPPRDKYPTDYLIPSIQQVEYHPCTTPNACTPLLREFMHNITPPTANLSFEIEHDYAAVGLSTTEFTPAHTGYQYMMMFRRDTML
ncbi:hypothetical protein BC936DRAFT_144642 [Jimgerdemannia flammicorona]|uniref:Uncharacterized protein n=1 Tax=Jimgerdemannia flammicorona TaxID=994334 RepID=A0A433DC37_9FUNG|nr:hypothetical protein BC936DRAFT_144642 [Jimgerdemannia flammicorona]